MKKLYFAIFSLAVFIFLLLEQDVDIDKLDRAPYLSGKILGSVPLLPEGQHIGIQKGFSVNTNEWQESVEKHFNEAISAGMSVYLKHIDWQNLERWMWNYDLRDLREWLEEIKEQWLKPAVMLSVIDSTSINVPDYLRGSELTLTDGMKMDDPRFIQRHNALMDTILPVLQQYDTWAIILLNEADNHIKDNPELIDEYTSFLVQSRNYIHSIDPDMAVAATLTSYLEEDIDLVSPLIDESDFASYNFYCKGGTTDGDDYGDGASYDSLNDRFLNNHFPAAKWKDIIIQEMWCASGFSDNQEFTEFSWYDWQAEYFTAMKKIIMDTPSIRAAFQFQLINSNRDDDQKYYGDILLEEGLPEESVLYLLEWLWTAGMLEYTTWDTKPSWNSFLELIQEVSNN